MPPPISRTPRSNSSDAPAHIQDPKVKFKWRPRPHPGPQGQIQVTPPPTSRTPRLNSSDAPTHIQDPKVKFKWRPRPHPGLQGQILQISIYRYSGCYVRTDWLKQMVSPFNSQLNSFVLLKLLPLDKLDTYFTVVFLNRAYIFTKSDYILSNGGIQSSNGGINPKMLVDGGIRIFF